MAGNRFGQLFSITTFGESHGAGIGVVIDGCPAGLPVSEEAIQMQLDRRRPGQSAFTTDRQEGDRVQILSGVFEGLSTGTPIALFIANSDARSADYEAIKDVYRPSHADYSYQAKYGIRDYRGGGRASARETAARVAAAAVARPLLENAGIRLAAWVSGVGEWQQTEVLPETAWPAIEKSPIRCPFPELAAAMETAIADAKATGDSLGGLVSFCIQGLPAGLGEPVFDKLEADLAKAMMSINAVKGFEVGAGFAAARAKGSVLNDAFVVENGKITTQTNHSGGIQGGISNGEAVYGRVAFKPVATIAQLQQTVNQAGEMVRMQAKGRHDPCVVPRAVPIVEAMAVLVIADHLLRQRSAKH
jgi:chorismate synthase